MSTIKYPVQAANGKLLLSENATSEAIASAIQTKYGERVLRNTYGNNLDEFTVTNDLSAVITELNEAVMSCTLEYRPLSISIDGTIDDAGRTVITVSYDDNDRTNTVIVTL